MAGPISKRAGWWCLIATHAGDIGSLQKAGYFEIPGKDCGPPVWFDDATGVGHIRVKVLTLLRDQQMLGNPQNILKPARFFDYHQMFFWEKVGKVKILTDMQTFMIDVGPYRR